MNVSSDIDLAQPWRMLAYLPRYEDLFDSPMFGSNKFPGTVVVLAARKEDPQSGGLPLLGI